MNETNFDWDDLRLFLAVARHGGLAPASEATGKSPPTLGRRMLKLERRLGRELFRRMARGYALTSEGEALLEKAIALEARVLALSAPGAGGAAALVKLSAGTWVSHILCRRHAEITGRSAVRLRFIAADEQLDIGHREAIIGIRNQRPEDPRLAGRRIGRIRFATYARDENITAWARVIGTTPSAQWVQAQPRGAHDVEVTHPRNALDLALAGAARAVLPCFIGAQAEGLRQVSPPIGALEHDQWLVTHHDDRFLPETRRVIDRIHTILKDICASG